MVTGRGALFLTDAVAANKDIEGISVHHEQSAAFAAVAYAQCTGKLGACLVSTGCAMTNSLTGVLNAWQDGIPCVFISGQNKLHETTRYTGIPLRTYGQQEADIIPIVASITKYAVMITDPNTIAYELEKALFLAQSGRKGPVWIDIPLDVQNMRIEAAELKHFEIPAEKLPGPTSDDLSYVLSQLNESERPTVLVGSGIRSAEANQELAEFIEKYQTPLTYTGSSSDIYGDDNELSIGSVGIMGCSRAGNFTIQNSDLVLVLGHRLSSMTTGTDYDKFARSAKVIVVDIDGVEHSKASIRMDKLIISDVKKFLSAFNKEESIQPRENWISQCLHWKKIFPRWESEYTHSDKIDLYELSECLTDVMPENAVFLSDSGLNELILPTNIGFRKNQRCIHPASQGSMGFALPATIGAHYASQSPLIAMIGDGSVMMNLQELTTIKYKNIPAKIFIISNNAYAVIRKRQIELFRSRSIGTDPSDGVGIPNFEKVAYGFEIPYRRIDNRTDLKQKLKDIISMNGPVICEIMGLENQDYATVSHVRNQQKRFVQRPLEDQAPFLDRDLFLSEMIIEPIDQ